MKAARRSFIVNASNLIAISFTKKDLIVPIKVEVNFFFFVMIFFWLSHLC